MMYGYGGVGVLFMALFWIGVIALIVWAIRGSGSARVVQDNSRRAIEILEQRYAAGEIDTEEFQQRRSELGK